jgi:hypothetical protein
MFDTEQERLQQRRFPFERFGSIALDCFPLSHHRHTFFVDRISGRMKDQISSDRSFPSRVLLSIEPKFRISLLHLRISAFISSGLRESSSLPHFLVQKVSSLRISPSPLHTTNHLFHQYLSSLSFSYIIFIHVPLSLHLCHPQAKSTNASVLSPGIRSLCSSR